MGVRSAQQRRLASICDMSVGMAASLLLCGATCAKRCEEQTSLLSIQNISNNSTESSFDDPFTDRLGSRSLAR